MIRDKKNKFTASLEHLNFLCIGLGRREDFGRQCRKRRQCYSLPSISNDDGQSRSRHKPYTKNLIALTTTFVFVLSGFVIAGQSTSPIEKVRSTKTLRSMARIYMSYGEYAKAQPLADKALKLARSKNVEDYELAMCLIDMATLCRRRGDLDDAEKMHTQGLGIQRKFLTENHPHIAYTLNSLSQIYYDQRRYSKAITAVDDAIDIMLEYHTPDDHAMASFYEKKAKNLTAQGHFQQAQHYYQWAMRLVDKSYGQNHLYTATVLAGIAELYTFQGEYDRAQETITRAIDLAQKIRGPDHYLIAPHWIAQAKIYHVTGDHAKARKLIDRALAAIKQSGNANAFPKLKQQAKAMLADNKRQRQLAKRGR